MLLTPPVATEQSQSLCESSDTSDGVRGLEISIKQPRDDHTGGDAQEREPGFRDRSARVGRERALDGVVQHRFSMLIRGDAPPVDLHRRSAAPPEHRDRCEALLQLLHPVDRFL